MCNSWHDGTLQYDVCLFQWHVLGDKTIFFIEDQNIAMKLKQLGTLHSSGGELRIVVKPSPPPMQGRSNENGLLTSVVCVSVCVRACVCVCVHVCVYVYACT